MSDVDTISRQQRRAWLWLAYSSFLFIDPIVQPSLRLWLGTLVVFTIFLGVFTVYVRAAGGVRSTRFWMIAATFVLGLVTFPWNTGGSTFFVYTAALLPFGIVSVRRVLLLFLAEAVLVAGEGYLFHISWPNIVIAVFLLLTIGCGNIFFAEQRRADCKLRLAEERNASLAAVAERERIARDLHDVLGHTLSVIVLKAELARRLMEQDPQRAAQEIADVESTARTALAEVRETIGGYRSQGLAAELEHARRTLDAGGVALTWKAPAMGSPTLSATEETVLSLSVREAVTNIVRHAEATRCTMSLATTSDGFYALLVEDNGRHIVQREGNGLRGMRERVHGLGGRFSVRSEHGTRLLIELPITSAQARQRATV
ncbi:sensor histidine kinase [Granulicella sp. dw_53]|uniref:sensor histidine kinase n=1 Tax=Granulicella sp. dw_53 TaxID=2719792 RepID=UPI001BD5F023|nr:sensor histidine kinase [Granulicella sp. dw_53]